MKAEPLVHHFSFALHTQLPRSPYTAPFLLGHAGDVLCHWAERTFLCPYLQQKPGVAWRPEALNGQAGYWLEHIWNAYSRCAGRDSLFLLRADTLKN